MNFTSRNVSSSHKIFLRTQWSVERSAPSDEPHANGLRATRIFRCPTGLSARQEVRFCFEPATDARLNLNDKPQALTIINRLATATITGMMESVNRAEILWRGEPFANIQLPEHFIAWLEISDDSQVESQFDA